MKLAVLTTLALLATTGIASAHDTWSIDNTQARQRHRIEQGRLSGELTRREYWRLRAEQRHIAAMERRAKADGVVTAREYHAIRNAQRMARRHIYQETHDEQVSRWRYR